jgi:hypothetical protein
MGTSSCVSPPSPSLGRRAHDLLSVATLLHWSPGAGGGTNRPQTPPTPPQKSGLVSTRPCQVRHLPGIKQVHRGTHVSPRLAVG